VRLDDFSVEREWRLPPCPDADSANSRYEGLANVGAEGRILLVNESPPMLVEVDPSKSPGEEMLVFRRLDARNVSAILLAPGGDEIVLVSRDDGLRLVRRDGTPVGRWHRVASRRIEGIALVPEVGLFLAEDLQKSRLLLFRRFKTWDALRAFLVSG
jgi:hypothetical protein